MSSTPPRVAQSPTPEPAPASPSAAADSDDAGLSIEEEMAALEAQVAEETERLQRISAQQHAMMASAEAAKKKARARPDSPTKKADGSSILEGALEDGNGEKVRGRHSKRQRPRRRCIRLAFADSLSDCAFFVASRTSHSALCDCAGFCRSPAA